MYPSVGRASSLFAARSCSVGVWVGGCQYIRCWVRYLVFFVGHVRDAFQDFKFVMATPPLFFFPLRVRVWERQRDTGDGDISAGLAKISAHSGHNVV